MTRLVLRALEEESASIKELIIEYKDDWKANKITNLAQAELARLA